MDEIATEETLKVDFSNMGHRGKQLFEMELAGSTRAAEAMTVQFALLQVTIEAWRRFGLKDEAVDALLANDLHTQWLWNVRNRVFHPALADEWEEVYDLPSPSLMHWATQVLDSMAAYCRCGFERPGWYVPNETRKPRR